MSHVMFDLETWGTNPGCAIRSIGAAVFNPEAGMERSCFETFYRNIEDGSCLMAGLLLERSTVNWWAEQSEEARKALQADAKPLTVAVVDFHNWFKMVGGEFIWCHGANFDEPIWKTAALKVGQALPWKFWNVRCTRTCYATASFDPRTVERKGVAHNALDDAIHQAMCVQQAIAKLRTCAPVFVSQDGRLALHPTIK